MPKRAARLIQSKVYLSSRILNYIGTFILMLMMILILLDVLLRNFINKPVPGSFEIVEYMMVVMIFFFFAHTQAQKGNVSVELFVEKLPVRVKAFLDSFNFLITTIFFALITRGIFSEAIVAYQRGEVSAGIFLPHYPFVFLVGIGAFFASIVFLIDTVTAFYQGLTGKALEE